MLHDIGVRLLRDRYRAISRLRPPGTTASDWFEARMMGRRALVVGGPEGVRLFYDATLVTRKGAIPAPVRWVLFGPGAVQGLAGEQHAARKRLFLDVVDRAAVERLGGEVGERLERAAEQWLDRGSVRLFDALVDVYGGAVIAWAGIVTSPAEAARATREMAAIVDGFGLGGTSYARAALGRVRATTWARTVVREVRAGTRPAPEGSVVATVAAREDLGDTLAGIELLNILRPTVAVAYFGAYAAQALAREPDWRDRLAAGSPAELRAFEHEVRRWYPFTPLLTGRLVRGLTWEGRRFPRRSWMVLDVLGTDLDPRTWAEGAEFSPGRFLAREPDPFEYVPHGGGDPATGHRCPGEPLAVGILEATIRTLAGLRYELAPGEDAVPLDRVPSVPPRGVELRAVRRAAAPLGS